MPYLRRLLTILLLPVAASMTVGWWQGSAVAPASGPAAAQEAAGHAPAAADDGHARSYTGKVLTKTPDLPVVTVGGQRVITSKMLFEQQLLAATPETLQDEGSKRLLQNRIRFTPFSHAPSTGAAEPMVTLIEMTDLSCLQCMDTLKAIDALMARYPDKLRLTHLYTPVTKFNDVNMAAFYGKVAARGGLFWEYRKALENIANPTPEAYFDVLIQIGMDRDETRRLMQTEARRFYRELDADARLSQQLNLGNPPHVMVNGIHVGMNGIPLDQLDNVVSYELTRPRNQQFEVLP